MRYILIQPLLCSRDNIGCIVAVGDIIVQDEPYGREQLSRYGDLHLHLVLAPDDALMITELAVEASLRLTGGPCAFNESFPQELVAVRYAPGLYLACAFLVSRFQPAPGYKVGELPWKVLLADSVHLGLTLVLVTAGEFDLIAQLAEHVDVGLVEHASKSCHYDIMTGSICEFAMNGLRQFLGVCHAFGYQPDHFLIPLGVGIGHIVADADVAPLQGRVHLAEFANYLSVKVRDASVVLPKLLDEVARDIAAADKVFKETGGYPLRVLHIALLAGQLLDEVRVHQFQFHIRLQHAPHRHPVDARALHAHLADIVLLQHGKQLLQLGGQHSKFFLINDAVLIENARKDAIFMDVKTANLSNWHKNIFGT